MPPVSAGLLLYRRTPDGLEVLLVHPGGPYWAKKDAGAWSIPKGEAGEREVGEGGAARLPPAPARGRPAAADLLAVAKREFREETSFDPQALAAPGATFVPLGGVKQRGHKVVYVWALEGDCDPSAVRSNEFTMEWPPGSGKSARFPEVDRAAWFDVVTAREKINPAQRRFLDDVLVLTRRATSSGR